MLVLLLVTGARAAEFKLEAQANDIVVVRNADKPFVGTIEKEDETLLKFRTLQGLGYTWPRSQVTEIRRKCTLQEAYQRESEAAGNDPRAHLRLYEACVEAGLANEALAELRKAISLDPKYLPAYTTLLDAARKAKNLDLEIGTLDAAIAADVATTPMLIRKAEICATLGLVASARAPLEKALRIEPFNAEAESKLAMLELLLGDREHAATRVQGMLRRDARNPHALLALGEFELTAGDLDKAARAFADASLAAGPKFQSPLAPTALGAIALDRGDVKQAAGYYTQAELVRPDFAPALAGQGLLAARRGQLKTAAELLDKAVALAPARSESVIARAYVAELADDNALAAKTYEAALAFGPPDVYALAGAGRCQWRLGNADKAEQRFNAALSIRPDFVPALRGLGQIALAHKDAKAVEYYRRVAASPSAKPEDHAALAGALIRLQRSDEAAAELAKAGSDNVHGRIGLGFLAYDAGRVDEAIAHFEAAVKLGDYQQYAAKAIERIRLAESRGAWSDPFTRDPPDAAEVRNGWKEIEPQGVAISIAKNTLVIDGKPATADRMARLERTEAAGFVSITGEAETGTEAESFVGVFLAPQGGQPVLFGRTGSGHAAVLTPGLAAPKELGETIAQGRFTVAIEIADRARGTVRLLIDGRAVPGGENVAVPNLAGAGVLDVGLFALAPEGKNVNCIFHAARIVRAK